VVIPSSTPVDLTDGRGAVVAFRDISDGYPGVNHSYPRRRSPSSAPPCKHSSRTRR
jgi:hypothetical protein